MMAASIATKRTSPMTALLRALLVAAAVASMVPDAARAQDTGDPSAGRTIASALCAQCHRVMAQDIDPNRTPPDFGAVANMPSFTELSMRVFLQTPHGQMPRYQFSLAELDDIIAYLASLRRR